MCNRKKTGAEHKADIQRWKREIEQEEAFTGSRWDAQVRQVLNMTDEELERDRIEDEVRLEKIRRQEQAEHAAQKAEQDALRQHQENQRLAVLAGIKQGAAEEGKKRVKQLADRQLKKVLGR